MLKNNVFISCLLTSLSVLFISMGCSANELGSTYTITNIRLNSGASAIIEKPKCEARSAVLMIHGWSGQKDEVGGVFKTLAEQLRSHCIASLRFDVRGESEHERSNYTITSTFESRVADAQSGLDYLKTQYPSIPLSVLGFSLGGATAMELVSTHPNAFDAMVLWSSSLNPNEIVTNVEYSKAIREALVKGKSQLNLWADFTLTREHIVGMLGYNPQRNLAQFNGHILGIRGTDDFLPAYENAIFEVANAVTEDAYYLGGADHIFHMLDPQKSQKDKVINLTMQWLLQHVNNARVSE